MTIAAASFMIQERNCFEDVIKLMLAISLRVVKTHQFGKLHLSTCTSAHERTSRE